MSTYKLQNATKGNVITRFPPEASGYLHIGHVKACIINYIVSKEYEGKMILRFDDTNPNKENTDFEHEIIKDMDTLQITYSKLSYTSDYFDFILEMATKLIEKGLAFCDCTDQETMNKERSQKKASKYRDLSIEENITIWKSMIDGKEETKKYCLRAKIDFANNNGTLRDPVIYRCLDTPHPRTKDKYKVYPTYDFSCPIVDSIEDITHTLRTSEYHDRNDQFYWICDNLGLRKPIIEDYSRLNMEYCLMSKRKLTQLVDMKIVDGWDDPRMPTLRGLLRHGASIEAIYEFVKIQGMSKNMNNMQWNKLWSINAKIIDNKSGRYTAIKKKVKCILSGDSKQEKLTQIEKLLNKKNPDLGTKKSYISNEIYLDYDDVKLLENGDEITLMDYGNIIIRNKGEYECYADLNLGGNYKTTKYKLHWLAENPNNTQIMIKDYFYLFNEKIPNLSQIDDKSINKNSLCEYEMLAEEAIKNCKFGDTIQLERKGFYIVDKIEPKLILINIPDGKQK